MPKKTSISEGLQEDKDNSNANFIIVGELNGYLENKRYGRVIGM